MNIQHFSVTQKIDKQLPYYRKKQNRIFEQQQGVKQDSIKYQTRQDSHCKEFLEPSYRHNRLYPRNTNVKFKRQHRLNQTHLRLFRDQFIDQMDRTKVIIRLNASMKPSNLWSF